MSHWPKVNWPKIGRDTILLLAGLGIVLHETVWSNIERPSLLVLAAGLIGLPAYLRKDEK